MAAVRVDEVGSGARNPRATGAYMWNWLVITASAAMFVYWLWQVSRLLRDRHGK